MWELVNLFAADVCDSNYQTTQLLYPVFDQAIYGALSVSVQVGNVILLPRPSQT